MEWRDSVWGLTGKSKDLPSAFNTVERRAPVTSTAQWRERVRRARGLQFLPKRLVPLSVDYVTDLLHFTQELTHIVTLFVFVLFVTSWEIVEERMSGLLRKCVENNAAVCSI